MWEENLEWEEYVSSRCGETAFGPSGWVKRRAPESRVREHVEALQKALGLRSQEQFVQWNEMVGGRWITREARSETVEALIQQLNAALASRYAPHQEEEGRESLLQLFVD